MSTSAHRTGPRLSTRAVSVQVSETSLQVRLEDGRAISVPLAWFPRLLAASSEERGNWRLIGHGVGIHWADLDEDISTENLLATTDDAWRESKSPPSSSWSVQRDVG